MGMPDVYNSARLCAKRETATICCNSPKMGRFSLSWSNHSLNRLENRQAARTETTRTTASSGQSHQAALAKTLAPLDDLFETQVVAIVGDAFEGLHEGNAGAGLKAHHGAELEQVPALDAGAPGQPTGLSAAVRPVLGLLLGLCVEQPITTGPEFFLKVDRVLGDHRSGDGPAGLVQTAILKEGHGLVEKWSGAEEWSNGV